MSKMEKKTNKRFFVYSLNEKLLLANKFNTQE